MENLLSHKELMTRLNYLKKAKGIAIIVGKPDSGKITSLRSLVNSLNPSLFKVIYFPISTDIVMDFYRELAIGLDGEPRFRKVDLFHQIQNGILKLHDDQKITLIFILDEM